MQRRAVGRQEMEARDLVAGDARERVERDAEHLVDVEARAERLADPVPDAEVRLRVARLIGPRAPGDLPQATELLRAAAREIEGGARGVGADQDRAHLPPARARPERFLDLGFRHVAGDHEDRDVQLAHRLELKKVEPAHPGETDVEQDDVGPLAPEQVERRLGRVHNPRLVAESDKELPQQVANDWIILDDEYAHDGSGWSPPLWPYRGTPARSARSSARIRCSGAACGRSCRRRGSWSSRPTYPRRGRCASSTRTPGPRAPTSWPGPTRCSSRACTCSAPGSIGSSSGRTRTANRSCSAGRRSRAAPNSIPTPTSCTSVSWATRPTGSSRTSPPTRSGRGRRSASS